MARKQSTFRSVRAFNNALDKMPAAVESELDKAARANAERLAAGARARASRVGGVAGLVAPHIGVVTDAGDATVTVSGPKPIGEVVFGAEYGGRHRRTTMQFLPWVGSMPESGYFLGPTMADQVDEVDQTYSAALGAALEHVG